MLADTEEMEPFMGYLLTQSFAALTDNAFRPQPVLIPYTEFKLDDHDSGASTR